MEKQKPISPNESFPIYSDLERVYHGIYNVKTGELLKFRNRYERDMWLYYEKEDK